MKNFLYVIVIISLLNLNGCFSSKHLENIIGVYYDSAQYPYLYKEIKNKLNEIVFKENFKIYFHKIGEDIKKDVDFFIKKRVPVVIVENNDLEKVKFIYNVFKRKKIKVALITSEITNTTYNDFLFTTDFLELGKRMANILYHSTRRKRNIFLLYVNNKEKQVSRKIMMEGVTTFLKDLDRDILIYTNYYTPSAEIDKDTLKKLIISFSNNFRGIFVDDDEYGVLVAKELRKMGKDIEIKVATFGATVKGINSILKTGIAVSGDINRISLYTNATMMIMELLKKKDLDKSHIIYYDKGVCYTQLNVMDLLAETRKFSIKEILMVGRKKL